LMLMVKVWDCTHHLARVKKGKDGIGEDDVAKYERIALRALCVALKKLARFSRMGQKVELARGAEAPAGSRGVTQS
jgi:hypothetical protein